MSEEEKQNLHRELCRGFAECCFEEALRTGAVNPQGKSDPELDLELLQYTLDHLDAVREAEDVCWIIDHSRELLKEARRYRRREDHSLAIVVYTTWCEHWLNSLIQTGCRQKGFPRQTAEQIIRDTPFQAKATWLLALFGFPPLPGSALTLLTRLYELRNWFVHYKFKPQGEQAMKQHRANLDATSAGAEELVKALQHYEDSCVFKRVRRKARRLARRVGRDDEMEPSIDAASDPVPLPKPDAQDLPSQSND